MALSGEPGPFTCRKPSNCDHLGLSFNKFYCGGSHGSSKNLHAPMLKQSPRPLIGVIRALCPRNPPKSRRKVPGAERLNKCRKKAENESKTTFFQLFQPFFSTFVTIRAISGPNDSCKEPRRSQDSAARARITVTDQLLSAI